MEGKILKLHKALSERRISVSQITEKYLSRIEEKDVFYNSYITETFDEARKNAIFAQKLFDCGKASLITGIPMSLKDILSTKGILTTAGSKVLSDYVPFYDAYSYECLKKAGSVLLGKNNMDEFAMGAFSDTSFYGCVKNPLDKEKSPGGSSGGSAAAVASGLSVYSLGSDTGGSIRCPAAYTGTVGLCPTYGAVSRRGLIAHSSALDRVGVLAGTVSDTAIVFDCINRYDEGDMTCRKHKRKNTFSELGKDIADIKIGVISNVLKKADDETEAIFCRAVKTFENLGAKTDLIKVPSWDTAKEIYSIISTSDAASNLSRYDGVRYGYAGDTIYNSRNAFGDEVRMRILLGNAILTSENELGLRKKAEGASKLLKEEFRKIFSEFDILICPSAKSTAPYIGEEKELLTDDFLLASSVSHLPALSMPMGFSDSKMSMGLQIIGKSFAEDEILKAAFAFEDVMQNEIYIKGEEDFGI